MRALKWIACLLVLGALAGGGWWWWKGRRASAQTGKMQTVKVDRGKISAKITATGTLAPIKTVQVGSQVSGRISEILVDFNSQVTKGQIIARIEPQLFQAAVEQGQANLNAAYANVTKAQAQAQEAERQLGRLRQLAADKLVAQAEVDTAEANLVVARAQVTSAQGSASQVRAALSQAQLNLTYTTIYSPIDGIVISRAVDVGQTVASSLQAPTLFTIAEDLHRMQIDTSVAEGDVGRLAEGLAVEFTVDAFSGQKFTGAVRQVRLSPTTVQNVVTYNAVIDVANPELKLRPGMTANVTFVLSEKDDVLRIPNAALRFRPPQVQKQQSSLLGGGPPPGMRQGSGQGGQKGDSKVLYVVEGKGYAPVRVRLGITDGSYTELVEGDVAEGALLVTSATTQPLRQLSRPSGGASAEGGGAATAPAGPPPGAP